MASWRPDHSMILSLLLDSVVGTKEMIAIRQDYCCLYDFLLSALLGNTRSYFTGSKAEGLDLPGSDKDYMSDLNNLKKIKVTQSVDENNDTSLYSTFFMSCENVPPGFALLEHLHPSPMNPFLDRYSLSVNDNRYLSSDFIIQNVESVFENLPPVHTVKRQGPSVETWYLTEDTSKSGTDNVYSIHCPFWPNESSEWAQRLRHFGWPTSQNVSKITHFGFHLVPIGHPHSETKLMEWRISFSMAERTLVWSFNYVQLQCYAVMKIILKEFIKVRCNPENQVLCSYFIKTFLFWQYETTELTFWREDNLRECIKYLLAQFSFCIQEGVLRHYFIPRFNLLSVKLTRAAQTELLQLFEIIIQSDISILKECTTLKNVWSEFLQCCEDRNNMSKKKRENLLRNDACMIKNVQPLKMLVILLNRSSNLRNAISSLLAHFCKTPLRTIVLKRCLLEMNLTSLTHTSVQGNKGVYQLCRNAQNESCSFDISTYKLWCAILLFKRGDVLSTLDIINQLLSSIPPFAMYKAIGTDDVKQLYLDVFLDLDVTMCQRVRKAWMFDLIVAWDITDMVPLAIQIELYFSEYGILFLSPFTCVYLSPVPMLPQDVPV